jgi:hypothetical protein
MIIPRKEENLLKRINKWTLVYGRRKTGKTFLIRNFIKYDEYFFVKRDRTIFIESTQTDVVYDTFIQLFNRLLKDKKTIVVDEFHRLGGDFLEHLHQMEKHGMLYVVSSTFHLAKKLITPRSPILGVFAEFPVGLMRMEDVVDVLPKNTKKKDLLEFSILLSEPLAIEHLKKEMDSTELAVILLSTAKYLVPALMGEIFREEERVLSNVYSGILRAIASGKNISTEISTFLFSRKLVKKDDPGSIQSYLKNLVEIGVVKRIQLANKNTYVYEHTSPLVEMYYYGDEKYNISELDLENEHFSLVYESIFPKIIERCVRSFLARKFGLREAVVIEPDYDIDGYLMKFKKCEIALEVKWRKKINKKEVLRAEEVLSKVKSKRKLLFVPDKNEVEYKSEILEIVDITDFI